MFILASRVKFKTLNVIKKRKKYQPARGFVIYNDEKIANYFGAFTVKTADFSGYFQN